MKLMNKLVTAGMGALALAITLGGAATPAEAAGGGTVYVGDFDPVYCRFPMSAHDYPTLQLAVDATPQPKQIIVCPGRYDPVTISGKMNMKIVGRPFSGVTPADGVTDYADSLIHVLNSKNITIQGLIIDGAGQLVTAGSATGIKFENSSGTITKNNILRIREMPLGDPDPSVDGYIGIWVTGNAAQKVKVTSNTIADYESLGVYVQGNVNATVSRNLVTNQSIAILSESQGILFDNVHAGSITSNTIQSDFYYEFQNTSFGIQVYGSSKIKVTGNKISNVETGIVLYANGEATGPNPANQNTVSGNTISGTDFGIVLQADDLVDTTTLDPHADGNKILNNKITTRDFTGLVGIMVDEAQDDDPANSSATNTWIAYAIHNIISGNKLYGYCLCQISDTGTNTIITNSNKSFPVPAGPSGAPSAAAHKLTLPHYLHHVSH